MDTFDWVFAAEADQLVDPYCWSVGLHDIINEYGADAHVILTDFAPHQTINEGTFLVRNTPLGRMFLEVSAIICNYSVFSLSFILNKNVLL